MLEMKDIVLDDNEILRQKSEIVPLPLSDEDTKILNGMLEYLFISQDDEQAEELQLRPGVGMAAVQVGHLKRMCAILIYDYDDEGNICGETTYGLVNPKIISHSERGAYLKEGEGCLSVNGEHQGYIKRHHKVTVKGYDAITEKEVEIVARGYLAIVLQHELDHFEGKLFYDYIDENNPYPNMGNAIEIE